MKLEELVQVSAAVAGTSGRLDKISKLAALFARIPPDDLPIAAGFLTGWPRQGKLGVGWASVAEARPAVAATTPARTLTEVDATFTALQAVRGKNSTAERQRI